VDDARRGRIHAGAAIRLGDGHADQAEVAQLAEQLRVVVVVRGLRAGVAAGEDARPAAQRVDLEAGIVGERRESGPRRVVAGLDPGIGLEGETGLVRLALDAHVVRREQLHAGGEIQQLAQLAELVA
jgi:hypothetical protein